jgi:hypothetical protein
MIDHIDHSCVCVEYESDRNSGRHHRQSMFTIYRFGYMLCVSRMIGQNSSHDLSVTTPRTIVFTNGYCDIFVNVQMEAFLDGPIQYYPAHEKAA